MIKHLQKYGHWFLIVLLLVYIYFNGEYVLVKKTENFKIDSIKVKEIIPEQKGVFENTTPQPIVVVVPSSIDPLKNTKETNEILSLIKSLQVTQDDQQRLLDIIAKKHYAQIYEDSVVSIEVKNTVENGKKTTETVNWTVKPSFIEYYQKKFTYKLKPSFTLSAGIGLDSHFNNAPDSQIRAILGFKNKKGYELQLGFTTDNRASLLLKKDLFTKYNYFRPP
jgi:hypothetical protein